MCLSIPPLTTDARLVDVGIDSFSLIELVFLAEEEFGVRIPMEELEANTVGDVVTIIQRFANDQALMPAEHQHGSRPPHRE